MTSIYQKTLIGARMIGARMELLGRLIPRS